MQDKNRSKYRYALTLFDGAADKLFSLQEIPALIVVFEKVCNKLLKLTSAQDHSCVRREVVTPKRCALGVC